MNTKVCVKCNIEKPVENFSKSSSSKDGLQSYCRECQSEANRASALRRKCGGGGKIPQLNKVSKIDSNNPLSGFTPRELMRELYNRGYIGELTFSQKIDISKL
jgi:hypothetical protein